jgi:hypothetical protein
MKFSIFYALYDIFQEKKFPLSEGVCFHFLDIKTSLLEKQLTLYEIAFLKYS